MLFINKILRFKSLHKPLLQLNGDDFLFCYQDNKILLTDDNKVPLVANSPNDNLSPFYCFGEIDKQKCFLSNNEKIAEQFNFVEFRQSCLLLPHELQNVAALG